MHNGASTGGEAMCELFGASAAKARGLAGWLNPFRTRGGGTADNPDGWGVVAYGHDRLHHCECDRLALVVTAPPQPAAAAA
jgi:hypothetical protein